jgi:hypothetical protein
MSPPMSSQPVQNRLAILSLFTLSVGGTFALFSAMPWIAQSVTAYFNSKPIDRVEAPLRSEAASSHPSKLAGTSKRVRPLLSRRKPNDTSSSRSTL